MTHALVSCLSEDRKLLRRFIQWVLKSRPPTGSRLQIVEQQLPGESPVSEGEAERRGLPDAWIHDGGSWALMVESKVGSSVRLPQLRRHLATAQRRGFEDINLLVLAVKPPAKLPERCRYVPWCEAYAWFRRQSRGSDWAGRMADYMEVAEARMVADEYLREGKLTMFPGVPFDEENPYNYLEAKRVLRLAMEELRQRKDFVAKLGVDPRIPGRSPIVGRQLSRVWDYLCFKKTGSDVPVTKAPHLTLTIRADNVFAMLTLPNRMKSLYRQNLLSLGSDGMYRLFEEVARQLKQGLKGVAGSVPWMEVLQRRYPTHRAIPVVDARLQFDLRTAFGQGNEQGKSVPKCQPQWLDAAISTFTNRRSNLQLGVGALFPYKHCRVLNTPKALDAFVASWIACKPLLDVVLGA